MQQINHPEFKPGSRVAALNTNGTPTGTVGTVKAIRDHHNTLYALVQFDSDSSRWNTDKPTRRTPLQYLKPIGCGNCGGTGLTAECREGTVYPSGCSNCFDDASPTGYLWDAEHYQTLADM